jgi:hypothetical protein
MNKDKGGSVVGVRPIPQDGGTSHVGSNFSRAEDNIAT